MKTKIHAVLLIVTALTLISKSMLHAGVVTADPSADSNNIIIISKDDTVTFTAASSGNDDYVDISDSTFQNGTPSFGRGEGTGTALVTFTSAALGLQNSCEIKVNSSASGTTCSTDKEIDFTTDVVNVTFADVVRDGNTSAPLSVSPTKTATVLATLTPTLPTGTSHKINISIDNGGDSSAGSATITTPSDGNITQTGSITLTGGSQTTPGHAGELYLQAELDSEPDKKTGKGAHGFSVAALPCNFSTVFLSDVNTSTRVGVKVQNYWESDSGNITDLDQVQRKEVIAVISTDNPPFTSTSGISTSDYIDATSVPTTDDHSYPRSLITLGPAGKALRSQIFEYKDARTGATDVVCVKSGFNLQHLVNQNGANWVEVTSKWGNAVGSVAAGSGSANSNNHTLP